MNPDLIILFVGELFLILGLYRFLFRKWVIDKWEDKIAEEGYLVVKLEPVIVEIEDRIHDKLQNFQDSFFGSIGAMTKKAQNLDPMNNVRKAAKQGDWMSLMVEYAANKAGLGAVLGGVNASENQKDTTISPESSLIPKKMKDLLYK
jgi:hypothetical protein